jgi:hypothetical protein
MALHGRRDTRRELQRLGVRVTTCLLRRVPLSTDRREGRLRREVRLQRLLELLQRRVPEGLLWSGGLTLRYFKVQKSYDDYVLKLEKLAP